VAHTITWVYEKSGASYTNDAGLFTTGGALASNQIRINPTATNLIGTYTVKVTFAPTYKRNSTQTFPQYTAISLTVGCILTAISNMNIASLATTYKIYQQQAVVIDFGASAVSPLTLTPDCAYTLSRAYTYANGTNMVGGLGYDTSVFSGTTDGKLTVSTTSVSKVGTYKINVTQTATDNVSYTFKTSSWCGSNVCPQSSQSLTKTIEYTIVISSGCSDTAFVNAASVTLSTNPLAPNVGQTATATFTNIQTNAEVSAGVNDICGDRTYRIINVGDTNAHSWITISGPNASR
jgi:hypothetical protein